MVQTQVNYPYFGASLCTKQVEDDNFGAIDLCSQFQMRFSLGGGVPSKKRDD